MKNFVAAVLAVVMSLLSLNSVIADEQADAVIEVSSTNIEVQGPNLSVATSQSDREGAVLVSEDSHSLYVGDYDQDSLQLLIKITDASAPEVFSFAILDAVTMEAIELGDRSLYRLARADNSTVAWLAEPWALDSQGDSISTGFTFSNGILTQTVEHLGSQTSYPVTADPYLGKALISNVTVSPTQGSYRYSVAVTEWLGVIYGTAVVLPWVYSSAYQIASVDGWAEVLSKTGSKYGFTFRDYLSSRATYRNQWDCHALGAPIIFVSTQVGFDTKPTWDLEGFRYSTTNLNTWIAKKCNW